MAVPSVAPARVTLFLMTEKGYRVLQHIVAQLDKRAVALVIGAPDAHLVNDYFVEIQALCARESIPFQRRTAGRPTAATHALAVAWRWLITDVDKLIVLHDSLLPRYRGFAPLVSCLLNGEPEIGVTALYATAEFDQGPVLAQVARPVQYPITITRAIALAVECYLELTTWLWPGLCAGALPPGTPQVEAAATYSLWRDEADYRIDWHRDSAYLRRFVDALGAPYRGASTLLDGQLCRVLAVEAVPDVVIENRAPGKVLFVRAGQPVVVCGTGLLRLTALRTEAGADALPLRQFRSRFG
ncbi:methionyl-tRNA formyltransferase [Hymenobacter sp. PAMC 26628]|uniref:methionyl-tRNA formyltransferase n=1 Tax=Hymenobacter sp. PAMC 26628 TaxID=1484118 RepID=UPI000902054A|nr:formyltransferase family protein [Hymenobacter sp. PAMC 26628]